VFASQSRVADILIMRATIILWRSGRYENLGLRSAGAVGKSGETGDDPGGVTSGFG